MHARLAGIDYHLPVAALTTQVLATEHPRWNVEKLDQASGISIRHIAAADECASDLAVEAARKLLERLSVPAAEIDFLLLCTQSPDFFIPTTACILQDRLGLPVSCGALDYNLGHSGFVYGLGIAEGLIASGQAKRVLLLTADTYSKHVSPDDKTVRTIFGDGAAATLLEVADGEPALGPFCYGTDGKGAEHLMVPAGGMRMPRSEESGRAQEDESGNLRSHNHLRMNGAEVFSFTLSAVPRALERVLERSGENQEAIDHFVFHQANAFILEQLRKRCQIPKEKFPVMLNHCGNTVSSSIPIALRDMESQGRLERGQKLVLLGYGAGYSWGATILRW